MEERSRPLARGVLGVVVAALVAVGGCAASTTAGSAVAAAPSAVKFDPCTQVTDAMVMSLGLLPQTKMPYVLKGLTVESGCAWQDSTTTARMLVDVGFEPKQIDAYLTNLQVSTTTELSIGGRRLVNVVTDTAGGGCNLAIDLGSAIAIVAATSSSQTAGVPNPDSRPVAGRIAAGNSPVLLWDRRRPPAWRGPVQIPGSRPEPCGVF